MKESSRFRTEGVIKMLNKRLGAVEVRKISKTMLEDWAAERGKEVSARTVNYEREVLIRILDYGIRDGITIENPARVIKRLKIRRTPPVIPTREQFAQMIGVIRNGRSDGWPAADLCEFLAYSGCRLGEAIEMRWQDILFDQQQFVVTGGIHGTKNHENRVVPLFPALEQLLHRLIEERGQPDPEEHIQLIRNAKRVMNSACQRAGLPHFSHHHLRHFFCSNAIEAGIDFKTIAGWLGHKDGGLLVAKTYGHLRDEHSALMAQKMTFGVDNGK
jgi:integrase